MVIFSHPTGNRNSHEAARALADAALLQEFWTCLSIPPSVGRGVLGRLPLGDLLSRRIVPDDLRKYVKARPWIEAARLLATRARWDALVKHGTGVFCIDKVCRDLDRVVAKRIFASLGQSSSVYAYEDGAWESFRVAKRVGLRTIYDLPIGYWRVSRQIFEEEADRLPEWRATMPGLSDCNDKLRRKDEELANADSIIVASSFTAKTLENAPLKLPTAIVIPYGCEQPASSLEISCSRENVGRSDPLRVLFVGSLSQRKGLYEVLRATSALGRRVSLTIVGRRVGECVELDRLLMTCKWIETAPHHQILKLMRKQDVLLFPSLFEGFGLVITEALSQGLPVITTANTIGPDILEDGVDGFIIPIRDWQVAAEKLETLDADRDLLAAMKVAALRKAHELTWRSYRDHLSGTVARVLGQERRSAPVA